jgi:hypothetical protein
MCYRGTGCHAGYECLTHALVHVSRVRRVCSVALRWGNRGPFPRLVEILTRRVTLRSGSKCAMNEEEVDHDGLVSMLIFISSTLCVGYGHIMEFGGWRNI